MSDIHFRELKKELKDIEKLSKEIYKSKGLSSKRTITESDVKLDI